MRRGLILLLLSMPVFSQPKPVNGFKVLVEVNSKDDQLRDLISSYLRRELRGLKDVEPVSAVNKETLYGIHMLVARIEGSGASSHVLALSTVFGGEDRSSQPPSTIVLDHELRVAADHDLQLACQEIVAHLDSSVLEPIRQAVRKPEEKEKTKSQN